MRLVRSPMRVSYVGGGTDYPEYFHKSPGGVLAAAINQYVYVYSNPLSSVAAENFRFTYRETESVSLHSEFKHPVMKSILEYLNWQSRQNFGTFADLPAGIGLGGSSAFTVAMAKLLMHNEADKSNPKDLARLAIHIERTLLAEPGGHQDQYVSAYGGIRSYDFSADSVSVSAPILSEASVKYLEERQILVWVGSTRSSSIHSEATITAIHQKNDLLQSTFELYRKTVDSLRVVSNSPSDDYQCIANAVRAGWKLKQDFSSTPDTQVDEIIRLAEKVGADGYKLCGAGGAGFVLILASPERLSTLEKMLTSFKIISPQIVTSGCELLVDL